MKTFKLTLVPQLDRSPRCVAFAETIPGKLTLLGCFAALLFLHDIALWWIITFYLLIFSLWPQYRWYILLAATWSFLLVGPHDFQWHRVSELFTKANIAWQINSSVDGLPLIIAGFLFAAIYVYLTGRFAKRMRHPILILICLYLGLMVGASYIPTTSSAGAFLWAFLAVFGKLFWFTCYSLKECRAASKKPLHLQLGQYLPFWEPTLIPFPKGSGYLKKIESKTSKDFAICQIKGLKLLLWALWLKLFFGLIYIFVYGYTELLSGRVQIKRELHVLRLYFDGNYLTDLLSLPYSAALPHYETAFQLAVRGIPLPWYTNWLALIIDFLCILLYVAFTTHIIIAVIRMCGFKALRNTYRPFASKTIAEFWNRYFYYFKELLVEFFFYPAFFSLFKKRPQLRMYTATMAAAFFGNFLFHFMRDIWFVVELGFFRALTAFHTYFVFTFILGNVIFFSQWLSKDGHQREVGLVSRILAPVRVLGFYCILTVFVDFRRENISDNIAFLLSLLPF